MIKLAWGRVFAVLFAFILTIYSIWTITKSRNIDKSLLCNSINVSINDSTDLKFVTKSAVIEIIKYSGIPVINSPLYDIPVDKLKKTLESKSYIKDVSLYVTSDGILHIELVQRCPIIRFALDKQNPFYIDAEGFVFPLSPTYTCKVPIVTGNYKLPFNSKTYKGLLPKNDTEVIRQLMLFSEYIKENEFWNAQITQINIDNKKNIIINTCTGDFDILLGNLDQFELKLQKLYSFYRNALPVEGCEKYKMLDLRFNKQVVATLK